MSAPMMVATSPALAPLSLRALGDMTNDDLRDMSVHGENRGVRAAAALVLLGRETAQPAMIQAT